MPKFAAAHRGSLISSCGNRICSSLNNRAAVLRRRSIGCGSGSGRRGPLRRKLGRRRPGRRRSADGKRRRTAAVTFQKEQIRFPHDEMRLPRCAAAGLDIRRWQGCYAFTISASISAFGTALLTWDEVTSATATTTRNIPAYSVGTSRSPSSRKPSSTATMGLT